MEFIVGTSIGAVSLLAGFKGAVDGFNLVRDIFTNDGGVEYNGLIYHAQVEVFRIWGESVGIEDDDGGLLSRKSDVIRSLVGSIIADILITQMKVADKYLTKYNIDHLPPPPPSRDTPLHAESQWIKSVRENLASQKQRHRVKWRTGDEQRIKELVERLTTLNDTLQKLVGQEIDNADLVSRFVAGLKDASSLIPITRRPDTSDVTRLLELSVQVKALVQGDILTAANQAPMIQESELDVVDDLNGRSIGHYRSVVDEPPLLVMVEWKRVSGANANARDLETRIKALGALLSQSNTPEFRHLDCLGVFNDEHYARETKGQQRRLGIVYRMPEDGSIPVEPVALLSLLKSARSRPKPPLGDRFRLAFRLATAVSLLHATNWIHKSLRSDTITFTSAEMIASPYLCGFQYSRPAYDESRETRPTDSAELNMYYHPDIGNGWTKVKEIYSLGVVLMEIAYWRPVFEERYRAMSMEEVSRALIDEMEGKFGQDLKGVVGKVFVEVILNCLYGDFGVTSDDTVEDAKLLQKQFRLKVVEPLSLCNA